MEKIINLDTGVKQFYIGSNRVYVEKNGTLNLLKIENHENVQIVPSSCYFSVLVNDYFLFQIENGKSVHVRNELSDISYEFNSDFYLWRNISSGDKIIFPNGEKKLCYVDLSALSIETTLFTNLPLVLSDNIGLFLLEYYELVAYDFMKRKKIWSINRNSFEIDRPISPDNGSIDVRFATSYNDAFLLSISFNNKVFSVCLDQLSGRILWLKDAILIRLLDNKMGMVFCFDFIGESDLIILDGKTGEEILNKKWEDRNNISDLSIVLEKFFELAEDKIVITPLHDFPMKTFIFNYDGMLLKIINHGRKELISRPLLKGNNLFIHYNEDQEQGKLSFYEGIFE